MPTVKLTPSTYYLSNSNYLSVSNASNMYDDTDSDTYATVTNSRSSTSSYYIYLRGFNFSQVPDGAIVSSFAVRLKARESGVSTSSSYQPYLANGTSAINGSCSAITTTATVHEFSGISADWETLSGYGSSLGIRINCRRSSKNTTSYMYIYGAEIEVTYALPIYHDVTVTNSTSATVTVSDARPLEGTDVEVIASTLDGITVTDNGTDVTTQFTQGVSDSVSQVPDNDVDTSFSDSGGAFYISSSSTSIQYLEYACGHSAEDPGTETSTNTYVKGNASGNTTTGDCIYSFDFSEIPVEATITSVSVRAYVARENATIDSTHVCRVSVYSGSMLKGSADDVSGTSFHVHTLSNVGTWTRAELQQARFHLTLGYYGGRIAGISWDVSFELEGYVYTITNVTADHAIVFAYTSTGPTLYVKQGSSWVSVAKAFVKTNGSWAQVALDEVFVSGVNYKKA